MIIKELKLKDFRNYKLLNLSWNENLNIIVGNNAQGKSNILESINLLATAKSPRAAKESELILWGRKNAFIKALIENQSLDFQIQIIFNDGKKDLILNNNHLPKSKLLSNYFNTVYFCPEDLMLIKGGPRERRHFLDDEISQVSVKYNKNLSNFKRILNQRNHQLKKQSPKEQIQIWTEQLIDVGSEIIKKRLEAVEKLKPLSRLIGRKITNGLENIEIKYQSTVENISPSLSVNDIREMYSITINKRVRDEYYQGVTLVGPHRDDMLVFVNSIDIRSFGSQGQQRTAALALKLAELEFIKSETGEYPVLLLDDVFSELDSSRREYLVNVVLGRIQTFITGTDLSGFNNYSNLIKKGNVYNVHNGTVKLKEV